MMKKEYAAVIVAGGTGRRMGRPKQYIEIAGAPMVDWSVKAFCGLKEFTEIILVLNRESIPMRLKSWKQQGPKGPAPQECFASSVRVVEGGATRLDSVRNGVRAVSKKASIIAVHDGARPLISADIIRAAVKAALKYGASVPAVPVKDTVKIASADGKVVKETVKRSECRAAQTPQCYRRDVLVNALEKFGSERDSTDESQLVEKSGCKVRIVPSSYDNIKITTPEDVGVAEALMKKYKKGDSPLFLRKSGTVPVTPVPKIQFPRIGFGYDIHRMVSGRPLILGGIKIPHTKGLLGHSDGDAVLHAACDAALGAVAAGEIGMLFPPTDLTILGISSTAIVNKVLDVLAKKGVSLLQMDISVVADEPKLRSYYPALRESVAKIFRMPVENVSIKAKSREGLGEIGHGQAIACYAVVMVQQGIANRG